MKLEDAKILIGDDSILARKQLKDIISSLGGRHFLDASNGQEVIDIYKEQSPEVVFLEDVYKRQVQSLHSLRSQSYVHSRKSDFPVWYHPSPALLQ